MPSARGIVFLSQRYGGIFTEIGAHYNWEQGTETENS